MKRIQAAVGVLILIAGGLCGATSVPAQVPAKVERINPAGLMKPTGYTHVVAAQGGKLVFIAGQVAFDKDGKVVGKGDLKAQTQQVYLNLRTALAAAGASPRDVVTTVTYIVGYTPPSSRSCARRAMRSTGPPSRRRALSSGCWL